MQIDFVRGIAAIFVGLILYGVVGLSSSPTESEPVETRLPPTAEATSALPTSSPAATSTSFQVSETATSTPITIVEPTSTPMEPTNTPLPVPTETQIPEPSTATVSSGVGVWLRATPSVDGEQLEWVLDGTVLTLLPGLETEDELEWQQVRTPEGNEGWVAASFIFYDEAP